MATPKPGRSRRRARTRKTIHAIDKTKRTSRRASAPKISRVPAPKARRASAPKVSRAPARKIASAPWSQRYTPELFEDARRRYEETCEPIDVIATDLGIESFSVRRLARNHNWIRRVKPPPRDLPPPDCAFAILLDSAYIFVGAATPSMVKPLRRTCRMATISARRASRTSISSTRKIGRAHV